MTKQKLYVRFVQFKGETIAVFMRSSAERRYSQGKWLRMSYQHIGQHGECYDGMQRRKKSTLDQYNDLYNELCSIGYNPVIV